MIAFISYLLKFSVSLTVAYLFYKIALYRLTFYNWKRFYLLFFILLSFVLPLINISTWMKKHGVESSSMRKILPLAVYSFKSIDYGGNLTIYQWILALFLAGIAIMLVRLIAQYLSLMRLRKSASLWYSQNNIRFFRTTLPISPFSFGQSIYLNKEMYSDAELERIIQHELIHVRQKHSIDLITAELICIINWFNPFAWFLRSAIRQNLEFIADEHVLLTGFNKKEYQYLLLKAVGYPQYSLANNLNFSYLKKRITMMNQMKSRSVHMLRFLFTLPLMALILFACRNEPVKTSPATQFTGADNAKPLYVVDGIVQNADFNVRSIPSASIREISVLKDTSAIKNYGKPGVNEVIEINLVKHL